MFAGAMARLNTWLNHDKKSVNVAVAGTYEINAVVTASVVAANVKMSLLVNGVPVTGTTKTILPGPGESSIATIITLVSGDDISIFISGVAFTLAQNVNAMLTIVKID